MTKVEVRYRLRRPLDQTLLTRLADLPKVYGLLRARLDPEGRNLVVEYDATRLTPRDVDAQLARAGLPIERLP